MPRARFLAPVYPGDTLTATSEVIGLRETSNGRSGVVWVRSTGRNQHGEPVLRYCRWVMVRKRDAAAPAPAPVVPDLAPAVAPADLVVPAGPRLHRATTSPSPASRWRWGDYAVGERIDHVDRVTIEEAEHMLATRLWQNTAKVHFDATAREDGRRLIYGGHVISLARALSFNGLANAAARRGDQRRRPRQPLLRRRHRRRLVRGARQGRDRAPPASARSGCARSRRGRARRPSRCGTRRASTCRTCCSTSTTGCWCRLMTVITVSRL